MTTNAIANVRQRAILILVVRNELTMRFLLMADGREATIATL
jgi:hypothetical protein